ncbi:MAG: hypothetical protein JW719_06405 [Pirellulales bacterium]|nr:hypothetical protein [Pirellulales bacterium]
MRFHHAFFPSPMVFLLLLSSIAQAAPGDVVAKFAAPCRHPTGLAFDGKSLWLADHHSGRLFEIDPKDGRVLRKLKAPCFTISGLAHADGCLYVLDPDVKKVFRFNPATGITENEFPTQGEYPEALAVQGKDLWLGGYKTPRLFRLSTEDGTRIDQVTSPGSCHGLAFDGRYLWVADRMADKLYMVCPKNGDVILAIDSPGKFPRGLAFDGTYLWNVDYQTDTLYKIVRDDGTPWVATQGNKEKLELVEEVRNLGPGLVTSADVYLAVPRDLPNQKLLGAATFTPEPTDFVTDQWGQKSAHYHVADLPPGGKITAKMEVDAELFTIRYYLFPERVGTLADVPQALKDRYLRDGSKFGVGDEFVCKTARQVVGKEPNCYWIARKLFDHVTDKIHYHLDGVWDIAPTVLKRGSGSCSEFSFVYIALCRAAGLPARYVGSVVVRGDDASTDKVYHRWPEVFLPGYGWVPVDPSAVGGGFRSTAAKADAIGHLQNRYLITTIGGGASEHLDWEYNINTRWQYRGPCRVETTRYGEWEPLRLP